MQLPLLEVFEIATLNPIKIFWPGGVHLAAVQPLFKQHLGTVTRPSLVSSLSAVVLVTSYVY